MRGSKLLLLLGLVLAMAGMAQAVTLQAGVNVAKFADFSSLYVGPSVRAGQTQDPMPSTGFFFAPPVGSDDRTIFAVSTISENGAPPFTFVGASPEQLNGMIYDLTPIFPLNPVNPDGTTTIMYDGLGRNPIVGAPAGTGGVLEIWLNPSAVPIFNALASDGLGTGPKAWDEADSLGNIAGAMGHAVGPDTFPTINQEGQILWLQLVLIPLPGEAPGGAVLSETLALGGSTKGSGEAFAQIVGGVGAGSFLSNGTIADYLAAGFGAPSAGTADLHILFDIDPKLPIGGIPNGWDAKSQDPTTFQIIPEPMTMLGVFLGIGGLGGYIRRRRLMA